MRSDTLIWMGINNVGDRKDQAQFTCGNIIESMTEIAKWLSKRSIASRIDIVFARSEEEARNALRIRERQDREIDIGDDLIMSLKAALDNTPDVDLTNDVA